MSDRIFDTTAVALAGIGEDSPLAPTLNARANILSLTAQAEAAVLTPTEPGIFSHDWRLAMAARIAALHGAADLAARYRNQVGDNAALCDPAHEGEGQREQMILRFMDRVASSPRAVTASEIAELQEVGLDDADIVRLCELNAFMAYQAGLNRGLSLLAGSMSDV